MKKSITFLFIAIASISFGQKLHSPAEIFVIIEKSEITYELGILENEIPIPDRSGNLNFNEFYRVINEDEIATSPYEISDETKGYLKEAEKFYASNDYVLARGMYMKALESDPTYFKMMTYIGQMYEAQDDTEKAIEWYLKAIENNYIDYMAHWFLADNYLIIGELDKAVEEITIAMIFNRNNPRLLGSFNNIYKQKKFKSSDWVFNPQIELDSIADQEYKVGFGEDWLGYALVKALWQFEPGYSESMGVPKGSYSTVQDKEAIVSLLSTLSKKKKKKVPEFKGLNLALENGMINEFILFEIVLPNSPFVSYQLPEETILRIRDYVIQVRGIQK